MKCGEEQAALKLFQQMQQEHVLPNPITFVGVLNACASVLALEEGRRAHKQIIESDFESNFFVRSSLVDMTCMPNVGAWKRLGGCSTRCHHMMWSPGTPCLEDLPCMGMVRKLFNILNRCVKRV